jgi:hypothetical protein
MRGQFSKAVEFCLFCRPLFSDFGPFLTHFAENGIFWASFFPFLLFIQVRDTVYSQTDLEAVLLPIANKS